METYLKLLVVRVFCDSEGENRAGGGDIRRLSSPVLRAAIQGMLMVSDLCTRTWPNTHVNELEAMSSEL